MHAAPDGDQFRRARASMNITSPYQVATRYAALDASLAHVELNAGRCKPIEGTVIFLCVWRVIYRSRLERVSLFGRASFNFQKVHVGYAQY